MLWHRASLWLGLLVGVVLTSESPGTAQIELTGMPRKPVRDFTLPQDIGGKAAYWAEPRLGKAIRLKPGPSLRPDVPALVYQEPSVRTDQPKDLAYVRAIGVTILAAGEIATAITRETGVAVFLQANWMREKVVLPRVATPARELMDSLRTAFPGRWWKTEHAWILALSSTEADLTMLTEEERGLRHKRAMRDLVHGLVASDWKLLLSGRPVPISLLRLPAQRAVMETVRLEYWDPAIDLSVPGLPAMKGQLTLTFNGSGKTATIGIKEVSRAHDHYESMTSFYDPETGELLWGVPPPR